MIPVIIAEKESMIEAVVSTLLRASDTPIRREMTTKMFNGTRKREATCEITTSEIFECSPPLAYRSTMFV